MTEPFAFVNNSRETYTPTHSGAIATCIRSVSEQAALEGVEPTIITRAHASVSETMPWDRLRVLPATAASRAGMRENIDRGRRRLTGWSRPDQWVYAQEVARALQHDNAPAAVLSNDPELAVYLRRRLPGLRVVHWFHNLELAADRFRRLYAADSGIISMAVSAYLARAVEQTYRMTPGRVQVSLNGVDTAEFAVAARPDRTPVVGFLGRIAVEKGADVLLDAAALLTDRGQQFSLRIVGDTNWGEFNSNPYVEGVQRRVAALRKRGVLVETPGHVGRANLPAALGASDIHVLPSRWDEPCALALLEGMASGMPVVASATGGSPEVVAGSGALFPAKTLAHSRACSSPFSPTAGYGSAGAAKRWVEPASWTWQATWERTRELIDRGAA